MVYNDKELRGPKKSTNPKKAAMTAKKDAAKAKAAKRAQEEEEEEALAREKREQEAEQARDPEELKKEAQARKLRDAREKGQEAFESSDLAEAFARFSECIELDPEDHIHWSSRAEVHKQLGHFEEALADAIKCTVLNPEFAKGWILVGQANFALQRLDAAEEAFKRVLILDPENAVCLDSLKNIEAAREEDDDESDEEEEEAFDALVEELQGMDLLQLKARASEEGLAEDKVEKALGGEDPKEMLVSLITEHKYLVTLLTEELQGLEVAQLRARALKEVADVLGPGAAPGEVEGLVAEAAGLDDPVGALKALIVKYLSDALVDVSVDDESDLRSGVGGVFLAGACQRQRRQQRQQRLPLQHGQRPQKKAGDKAARKEVQMVDAVQDTRKQMNFGQTKFIKP